jgi:hypothetical protein
MTRDCTIVSVEVTTIGREALVRLTLTNNTEIASQKMYLRADLTPEECDKLASQLRDKASRARQVSSIIGS